MLQQAELQRVHIMNKTTKASPTHCTSTLRAAPAPAVIVVVQVRPQRPRARVRRSAPRQQGSKTSRGSHFCGNFPRFHMGQQYTLRRGRLTYYQLHNSHNRGKRQGHKLANTGAAARQVILTHRPERMNEQFCILPRRCVPYVHEPPARRKAGEERVLSQAHVHIVAAEEALLLRR